MSRSAKTSKRFRPQGHTHERKTPSSTTKFEMNIRADRNLNVTTRLLWLLVALSHKGHTYLSEAEMAKQLSTSVRQVEVSLKFILGCRHFRQVRPPGVHQSRQYHRMYEPDESPDEFVRRIQSDGRFDLGVLLHWIACNETAADSDKQFPTPLEWNASREALRLVRRKMQRLSYFRVRSDPRTGMPATYARATDPIITDAAEVPTKTAVRGPRQSQPESDERRRERALDRQFEEAWVSQQWERRRRDQAELEFSQPVPIRPARPVAGSRRVIRSFGRPVERPERDQFDDLDG